MLAIIRPDSWNLPLFLHVLGAATVTGATAATLLAALAARRRPWLRAAVSRTLLLVVFPSWLLMRVTGQWIDSKEDIPGDPGWLGVGFIVGDAGLVLLILTMIFSALSVRRPERQWPLRAVAGLSAIYLAALLVAMFAMSGKPGS